jgi:pilus assembly protein CpaE
MSANLAVVSPPQVSSPEVTTSVVSRNRIVCFVNDDISAAVLSKGFEGSNLEVRRGTIHHAIRMLETDTELLALVADISGIDDPFTELEKLSRVCPPDVRVALIGESTDIPFYRSLM